MRRTVRFATRKKIEHKVNLGIEPGMQEKEIKRIISPLLVISELY